MVPVRGYTLTVRNNLTGRCLKKRARLSAVPERTVFMDFITGSANCFICCAGLLIILAGYVADVVRGRPGEK